MNQLSGESSTYLLQHKDNPVDWFPWGEEALQLARSQNRPILLSIGYAACHWCHVMAHESFEDTETAAIMNSHFVNIKVDREERPDIDAVYMASVVAVTGHGGWPLTVFLTPDTKPFYGGTYFPKISRSGLPSFKQLLLTLADAWQSRQLEVLAESENISKMLRLQAKRLPTDDGAANLSTLTAMGEQALMRELDSTHGGFGHAPKFPQPSSLDFLLRRWEYSGNPDVLMAVTLTLTKMREGGIYDQLAGGIARYATDSAWQVPHFEKMLYDNALLGQLYIQVWQATREPLFKDTAIEILEWMCSDLRNQEGGFYSSLDADSDGSEGQFYIWDLPEVERILGPELTQVAAEHWGITAAGNFEQRNILHVAKSVTQVAKVIGITKQQVRNQLKKAKELLLATRLQHPAPALDVKVITAWNGMAITACAEVASATNSDKWLSIAANTADFIWERLWDFEHGLYRIWTTAQGARHTGTLEDYAFLAQGLLALWETCFEPRFLHRAEQVCRAIIQKFYSEDDKCLYDTSITAELLITRPRSFQDGSTPAAGSVAAMALLRISAILDSAEFKEAATVVINGMAGWMKLAPTAVPHWLAAADFLEGPLHQLIVVGKYSNPLVKELLTVGRERYSGRTLFMCGESNDEESVKQFPFLQGRTAINGVPTAYFCQDFVCHVPTSSPTELKAQIKRSTSHTI